VESLDARIENGVAKCGYHPGTGIGSVIVAVLYALVDGAAARAVFGWTYNAMARVMPSTVQ
jgi:hypothetical protein